MDTGEASVGLPVTNLATCSILSGTLVSFLYYIGESCFIARNNEIDPRTPKNISISLSPTHLKNSNFDILNDVEMSKAGISGTKKLFARLIIER